jgi:DNA-directed RNA polymerase subunit RPC12/RpoP
MSAKESIHGLNCPRCGGIVPLPEGQLLVKCPYCEQRSFVRGERGLRRYQVAQKVDREAARAGLQQFLSGHRAITPDAIKQARLTESFVAYLPFWVTWARVLGWVFGQEKVGSGDDARWEPREVKIAQEMNWNQAACDVGEFGVTDLPLTSQTFEPFDPEALHAAGLVFEPVGSASQAQASAEQDFAGRVRQVGKLDRVAQVFSRLANARHGLVYYPLWVLRYLYKGRAFQVVVDGHTGRVLYGKAPGSNLYRAAVLVGGMALGAFLAVDVSALAFYIGVNLEGDAVLALLAGGVAALAAGFGLMGVAYRKFRYGEIFEYRGHQTGKRRTRRQKRGETYHAQEI